MENGGDWGKMVENWVLFCIKVGGELLGFKVGLKGFKFSFKIGVEIAGR